MLCSILTDWHFWSSPGCLRKYNWVRRHRDAVPYRCTVFKFLQVHRATFDSAFMVVWAKHCLLLSESVIVHDALMKHMSVCNCVSSWQVSCIKVRVLHR